MLAWERGHSHRSWMRAIFNHLNMDHSFLRTAGEGLGGMPSARRIRGRVGWLAYVQRLSIDSLSMELPEPRCEQQDVKERQSGQHGQQGEVRKPRHQGATQALARINQRIQQQGILQDAEVLP